MTGRWIAPAAAAFAMGTPCTAQETVFEGNASGALFLNDGVVAVAEGNRVLLMPVSGRQTATLDGPFASVKRIVRSPDGGLVVWDDSLYAAFVFDGDEERRVVPFFKPGLGGGEVNFVALLAGDAGLFAEVDPGNPFALSAGPARNPVRYTTIAADGTRNVVWEALGKERVIHRTGRGMASAPVIFGYEVFAAHADGGRFVVAQTEAEVAFVLGPDGTQLGAVPMPSFGPAVSQDQIKRERARLIASYDPGPMEDILSTLLPENRVREAVAGMSAGSIEALRAAPVNPVPPRISDLRVDRNERVWMRRFVAPGAPEAVWDVRPLDGGGAFTAELPAHWTVFDAHDGRILAGVRDETGTVTSVVLTEISPRGPSRGATEMPAVFGHPQPRGVVTPWRLDFVHPRSVSYYVMPRHHRSGG